jgi:hypothetical protein
MCLHNFVITIETPKSDHISTYNGHLSTNMSTSFVSVTPISLRSNIFETPKQQSNYYCTSLIGQDILDPPPRRSRTPCQISFHRELKQQDLLLPTFPLFPNLDDSNEFVKQEQHKVILKMKLKPTKTTFFIDELTTGSFINISNEGMTKDGAPRHPPTKKTNIPKLSLKSAKAA